MHPLASGRKALAAHLRTSSCYDVLDDAVMGALTEATVVELFQDFDLDYDDADNRKWFHNEIDYILMQGEG